MHLLPPARVPQAFRHPLRRQVRRALILPAVSALAFGAATLTSDPVAAAGGGTAGVTPGAAVAGGAEIALLAAAPAPRVVQRPPLEPVAAVLPVTGYEITGTFGSSGGMWSSTHTGLDFAAPYGSPVVAVLGGRVVSTEYDGAFGLKVVVRSDDGSVWWYCHLAETAVTAGDRVEPGTALGAVGLTGNTTGPHLHLEVHHPDALDPAVVLTGLGLRP